MRNVIANSFHTLITQPTTLCNLDCAYCYLPDRKRQQLMSIDVAEALVESISEQDSPHPVDVIWHGGEPLATPTGHMRSLLAEFEDLRSRGRVMHGLQTNATLINAPWCDLLADCGFQVGVSIDGPAACSAGRVDRRGEPGFERIMQGIAALRAAGISYTAICVVTPDTVAHVDELVGFFVDLGCTSVGFNLEEQEGVNIRRTALTAQQAERFWLRLWQLRESGSPLAIRDLDRLCDWLETTKTNMTQDKPFDPIPTVSSRGDVVILSPELLGMRSPEYGDFLIGNVLQDTIPAMLTKAGHLRYVQEFADGLVGCASACEFFDFCRGAQAGNRYFEHGTFAATETAYCRNTRQALVRAAVAHLSQGEVVNP
jgi:uncharacterized protein